jgi:uncharacterized heparinase superfamily protein
MRKISESCVEMTDRAEVVPGLGQRRAEAGSSSSPDKIWSGMLFRMARLGSTLPGYGKTLGDTDPGPLLFLNKGPWRGDAKIGSTILGGVFPLAGQTVRRNTDIWSAEGVRASWHASLHGFTWLGDLAAVGDQAARRKGIGLIMDWIDHNHDWTPVIWRAPVLGARVASWLAYYDFFFGAADEMVQRRVRKSLARQAVHLGRVAAHECDGADRIRALTGAAQATICLPKQRKRLDTVLRTLTAELDRQILPDGGHVERNPSVLVDILYQIAEVKNCLNQAQLVVPDGLQSAIDRMAPMVRFLRHGDGGLALFNGSVEGDPAVTDRILQLAESAGRAFNSAPYAGFERLEAGRSLIVVDAGDPPKPGWDSHAHAGALSFEFSTGKERMIVNCGATVHDDEAWREAQRSTPAHSTLSLALTNSSALTDTGFGARRAHVTALRKDAEGCCLLEMQHSGFSAPLGFKHFRRIFLNQDGTDLRGEDRLIPIDPNQPVAPRRFEVRFHLHPSVQASLLANHEAALLKLPSGAGWRFRSGGAAIRLEDSIYMGRRGDARRSQQLVLTGETHEGDRIVKWAIRRESQK